MTAVAVLNIAHSARGAHIADVIYVSPTAWILIPRSPCGRTVLRGTDGCPRKLSPA